MGGFQMDIVHNAGYFLFSANRKGDSCKDLYEL